MAGLDPAIHRWAGLDGRRFDRAFVQVPTNESSGGMDRRVSFDARPHLSLSKEKSRAQDVGPAMTILWSSVRAYRAACAAIRALRSPRR
jgi:hypothetical protein